MRYFKGGRKHENLHTDSFNCIIDSLRGGSPGANPILRWTRNGSAQTYRSGPSPCPPSASLWARFLRQALPVTVMVKQPTGDFVNWCYWLNNRGPHSPRLFNMECDNIKILFFKLPRYYSMPCEQGMYLFIPKNSITTFSLTNIINRCRIKVCEWRHRG